MKKLILISLLISSSSLCQDINKYIFSSGMKFNVWNVSIFDKDGYIYFNYSSDENYSIYQEAIKVIESNGMIFSEPNEYYENTDGIITITNVIYENVPYGSNSNYKMIYENESVKITVYFSEKGSKIFMHKK